MQLTIRLLRETDGRWIGDVPELPGVSVYGATSEEATVKAKALALRVIAEEVEHGEMTADDVLQFSPVASANGQRPRRGGCSRRLSGSDGRWYAHLGRTERSGVKARRSTGLLGTTRKKSGRSCWPRLQSTRGLSRKTCKTARAPIRWSPDLSCPGIRLSLPQQLSGTRDAERKLGKGRGSQ
jgi:predicted RNase H-like HicB family nuclease